MLAALRKLLPQRVDFSLVVAIDYERDCGRELVLRPAIQRQESLAVDLEENRHHRALLAGSEFAVARRRQNAAVRKDLEIVADGLLGVGIEPETGRDFLLGHRRLLLRQALRRVRPTPWGAGCSAAAIAQASLPAKWWMNAPPLRPRCDARCRLVRLAYPPVGIIVKRQEAP